MYGGCIAVATGPTPCVLFPEPGAPSAYQAARCNTPRHAATRCNTPRHAATRRDTLQHAATRRDTLQHATTRWSTPGGTVQGTPHCWQPTQGQRRAQQ